MKVKELITQLQAIDPELTVMRDGYEGGVTEATQADVVTVALNVNTSWYYGEHEVVYLGDPKGYTEVQAVRIY